MASTGMNNHAKVDGLLSKAKINLMTRKDSVFITTVLFSLNHKWDNSIQTGATDGINLFLNPKFFEGLDFAERVFLLAHETWHVVFKHMDRCRHRDMVKWNIACDHVINLMLKDSGFKVIRGACCDDQYRDMSAEEIYDLLPDPDPNDHEGHLQPPPGSQPGATQAEKAAYENWQNQVDSTISRAAAQAEKQGAAGSIPGEVERYLEKMAKPKVDWRKQLQAFFTAIAKTDYSMRTPNRRFINQGIYLPSMVGEHMGEIAFAVDTSGSVQDHEFAAFLSEIRGIKQMYNPDKMTIIDFDTSIKNVHEIKRDESIDGIKFNGYGGTDMWPVFDHYKGKQAPKVLIVFSDMYCDMSMPKPPYPVIWVCVNRPDWDHEWGIVIHYDTEENSM